MNDKITYTPQVIRKIALDEMQLRQTQIQKLHAVLAQLTIEHDEFAAIVHALDSDGGGERSTIQLSSREIEF